MIEDFTTKNVTIKDMNMIVTMDLPNWVEKVEIQIVTDRNCPLSKYTDVAENNPHSEQEEEEMAKFNSELLFPIVDIEPKAGMELRFAFANDNGEYCFNPMYDKKTSPLSKLVNIQADRLERWENLMYITSGNNMPVDCRLVQTCLPFAGKVWSTFKLLSKDWSGVITIVGMNESRQETLYTDNILSVWKAPIKNDKKLTIENLPVDGSVPDLSYVENSISETLSFLFRAKNESKYEPSSGGMYLFYDVEKKCFRANHWNWTWGPAIKFMIEAANTNLSDSPDKCIDYARSMADVVLRYQHGNTDGEYDFLSGIGMGRWQNNLEHPHGVMGYYSVADSGFCAKWGLMPLYEKTKDEKYLKSVVSLYEGAKMWMEKFSVIPSDYREDIHDFTIGTLDETMFGSGLFEALWKATNNEEVRSVGKKYFKNIVNVLNMDNGMWARFYIHNEQKSNGFEHDTKGHGWAMDGLLCAYEMDREDDEYLRMAQKTADFIIENQQPDGFFNNYFAIEDGGGIGEKSTALWSWLLYRLYSLCRNEDNSEKYLIAARRALCYLMRSQQIDGDPMVRGGLIAESQQSGIVYRPFFKMACTYASSFFGLAAIEEWKLQKENNNL